MMMLVYSFNFRDSWLPFVLFCLASSEQFFSYIMSRTSYNFMRWWWWCPLSTRPTTTISWIFIVLRRTLWHIILILSQSFFAHSLMLCA